MKLKFEYAGVGYSTDTILEFTKAGLSPFWTEPLFHFYPDMDKAHFLQLDYTGRKKYLSGYFTVYESKSRPFGRREKEKKRASKAQIFKEKITVGKTSDCYFANYSFQLYS